MTVSGSILYIVFSVCGFVGKWRDGSVSYSVCPCVFVHVYPSIHVGTYCMIGEGGCFVMTTTSTNNKLDMCLSVAKDFRKKSLHSERGARLQLVKACRNDHVKGLSHTSHNYYGPAPSVPIQDLWKFFKLSPATKENTESHFTQLHSDIKHHHGKTKSKQKN